MGERSAVLFNIFLLGAFALLDDEWKGCTGPVHFHAEWIVPAELDSCLAYSQGKTCTIYDDRPVSCRNFPVINSEGGLHDFCPYSTSFSNIPFYKPNYAKRASRLVAFLEGIYEQEGRDALSDYLFEESPEKMPLLYNGLWCLFLKLAGMELASAIKGQRRLLKRLRNRGMGELTVLIPGSDYCITGQTDGLLINLDYLAIKLEKEGLERRFSDIISEISLA